MFPKLKIDSKTLFNNIFMHVQLTLPLCNLNYFDWKSIPSSWECFDFEINHPKFLLNVTALNFHHRINTKTHTRDYYSQHNITENFLTNLASIFWRLKFSRAIQQLYYQHFMLITLLLFTITWENSFLFYIIVSIVLVVFPKIISWHIIRNAVPANLDPTN